MEVAPSELTPLQMVKALSMMKPSAPLAPYDTVTHVGVSKALVLPDGDGDHLTLFANQAAVEDNEGNPKLLVVHGIASDRVTSVVRGRETTVPVKVGQKLTIKVIGDAPIEFVPASDAAKAVNRLAMKNANEVTKVPVGGSITFERASDVWKQL